MIKYVIFGSKESTDIDIAILIAKPVAIQEGHELIKAYEEQLSQRPFIKENYPGKPLNATLIVVQNGSVVWSFKGYPAETNNAIYLTYHKHKQEYDNPIHRLLPENKVARVNTMLRKSLIIIKKHAKHLNRHDYRTIKRILNTSLDYYSVKYINHKITLLQKMLLIYKDRLTDREYNKIAFQVAKSYHLIYNKRLIYDKRDLNDGDKNFSIIIGRLNLLGQYF